MGHPGLPLGELRASLPVARLEVLNHHLDDFPLLCRGDPHPLTKSTKPAAQVLEAFDCRHLRRRQRRQRSIRNHEPVSRVLLAFRTAAPGSHNEPSIAPLAQHSAQQNRFGAGLFAGFGFEQGGQGDRLAERQLQKLHRLAFGSGQALASTKAPDTRSDLRELTGDRFLVVREPRFRGPGHNEIADGTSSALCNQFEHSLRGPRTAMLDEMDLGSRNIVARNIRQAQACGQACLPHAGRINRNSGRSPSSLHAACECSVKRQLSEQSHFIRSRKLRVSNQP